MRLEMALVRRLPSSVDSDRNAVFVVVVGEKECRARCPERAVVIVLRFQESRVAVMLHSIADIDQDAHAAIPFLQRRQDECKNRQFKVAA